MQGLMIVRSDHGSGAKGRFSATKRTDVMFYALSFLLTIITFQVRSEVVTLSTDEIVFLFGNSLDRAELMDTPGVHAETHWYAGGHFQTRWWSSNREGSVTGLWTAKDNKRCVLLSAPWTTSEAGWQCAAILKRPDGRYISLNPDGSLHGLHQLSVIPASASEPLP